MRYYIDTEFDGFRGPLISMALVREDGRSLYFVIEEAAAGAKDPWVIANVIPILRSCPEPPYMLSRAYPVTGVRLLSNFLAQDATPWRFISDWPDDIRHLCDVMHHTPGEMVPSAPVISFEVHRVDAYPTSLPGAVQHNAWWDAVALREKLLNGEVEEAQRFARAAVK